jgi:hypothetical protein
MTQYDIESAISEINAGQGGDTGANAGQPAPQGQPINQLSYDPNLNIPYKANGKELTEPLSTVIQRASMGYNYAQLMQQHKQREAELEAQRQQIAQQAQKWQGYDEYANQNPQWADFVRQQWENRFNFGANQNQGTFDQGMTQPQHASLPPEVAKELAEMRSFVDQFKAQEQARMQAEQDAALNEEITSIQNQYPQIDLRATDPMTGESLEQQILRHAQAYGISSFRAAFRDMMFDKLLAQGQTQAKEVVAKQMQQQVKQGFLGQSGESLVANQQSPNIRGHSYHSLMDVAARELGLQ